MWFYNQKKAFLARLTHNEDLLERIAAVFAENGSRMGVFFAIGAVQNAHIAYYEQRSRNYRELSIDEPAEILSCTGNVSLSAGKPFVHAHISLGMSDGSVKGGHLLEGTMIFACELYGVPLEGDFLERVYDDVTGLRLWGDQ